MTNDDALTMQAKLLYEYYLGLMPVQSMTSFDQVGRYHKTYLQIRKHINDDATSSTRFLANLLSEYYFFHQSLFPPMIAPVAMVRCSHNRYRTRREASRTQYLEA